jgi:hypothetical protein
MVLVSGPELIDDVRKASDDVLSAIVPISDVRITSQYNFEASYSQGISQLIQAEYTVDLLEKDSVYHAGVIRTKLTRNIAVSLKDVHEEFINTLEGLIPTGKDSR